MPSTSARPPKAPKRSARGKAKKQKAAAAEVEVKESRKKYSSFGILGGGKWMPGTAKMTAAKSAPAAKQHQQNELGVQRRHQRLVLSCWMQQN